MSETYKPYAAALVFLIKDNSILLLRRANTNWGNGQYTVPSGHIEANEPATAAAVRETAEEVGVTIDSKDLEFVHILHRQNHENNREYVDFFFAATTWQGEPIINESDKCDDVRWFQLDSLPENIIPFIKDVIDAYKNGIVFSEIGWKK